VLEKHHAGVHAGQPFTTEKARLKHFECSYCQFSAFQLAVLTKHHCMDHADEEFSYFVFYTHGSVMPDTSACGSAGPSSGGNTLYECLRCDQDDTSECRIIAHIGECHPGQGFLFSIHPQRENSSLGIYMY